MLLIFGRNKERKCDFRVVKVGISWEFEIILFHELDAPGKKTILVSGGLTPYFLKGIRFIKSIQGSTAWRWFVSKIRRGLVLFNFVYLENAPATTTVRVSPIPILRKVWSEL